MECRQSSPALITALSNQTSCPRFSKSTLMRLTSGSLLSGAWHQSVLDFSIRHSFVNGHFVIRNAPRPLKRLLAWFVQVISDLVSRRGVWNNSTQEKDDALERTTTDGFAKRRGGAHP